MASEASATSPAKPVLRVNGLTKTYRRARFGWPSGDIVAARNISFEIRAGETLALTGHSGSGKSTVARCVTGIEKPDAGQTWLEGTDLWQVRARDRRALRSRFQLIFQDASTSMNPRFTAAEIVEEPLVIQGMGDKSTRRARSLDLMREVGLTPQWAGRRAMHFSGGQQQRLAIARALALQPGMLVLDEALSGLDLSTEAQIVNLLLDLQAAHSLAYFLISHDLALVARLADRIAIMAHGEIVEQGPTSEVLSRAKHPETQALLASARAAEANLAALGVAL
jgi:peptide/nickel transport system ATP-binding protein